MWSWPLYSPLCQTKWTELVLNKCLNGSPFAQNVERLPVVCRIKSKLYFLAFKPFQIIFCFFNLILYSLTLSSKYFLCNIPCSGTTPCVLPFPFPCLSKPIQKRLPCARHCSNLWCYSNEQNRRQSLCFCGADIRGEEEEEGHCKQIPGGNECNEKE